MKFTDMCEHLVVKDSVEIVGDHKSSGTMALALEQNTNCSYSLRSSVEPLRCGLFLNFYCYCFNVFNACLICFPQFGKNKTHITNINLKFLYFTLENQHRIVLIDQRKITCTIQNSYINRTGMKRTLKHPSISPSQLMFTLKSITRFKVKQR